MFLIVENNAQVFPNASALKDRRSL